MRIKLSELCYKSIASDSTEDKKHIDLSSEPLIVVCAAGLSGSTADDVAKEVAIYRAHKASPVVIATDGQSRYASALHVIPVPETHPDLAFVLSAMAGHVFGYEAALAIDGLARPLREARAAIEGLIARGGLGTGRRPTGSAPRPGAADDTLVLPVDGEALLRRLRPDLEPAARRYFDGLRVGGYDGQLEASTAVRLAALLRYVLGVIPLDAYQVDQGKVGTPAVVIDDLTAALTQAIEELTRPVDAIKHQAKTVTVGISRSDETLLEVPLVREVVSTGAHRDQLTYRTLRTLADISPAVAAVVGYTRYRIEGRVGPEGTATATVVDRGGIARDLPSRTDRSPELRGTKHRVASERELLVARGRRDGRPIVIVPEVKDGEATGITLLHVRFADPPAGGDGARDAAGLPQPLRGAARRGARDRADLPRGPARRHPGRRPAHRADQPARRPVAHVTCRPPDRVSPRVSVAPGDRNSPGKSWVRWRSWVRSSGWGSTCARSSGCGASLARTSGFADRVFTAGEQDYCRAARDPAERFAVRYAAKEAVLKAVGAGLGACRLRDIEVVRAESGAPAAVAARHRRRAGGRARRRPLAHQPQPHGDDGRGGRHRRRRVSRARFTRSHTAWAAPLASAGHAAGPDPRGDGRGRRRGARARRGPDRAGRVGRGPPGARPARRRLRAAGGRGRRQGQQRQRRPRGRPPAASGAASARS